MSCSSPEQVRYRPKMVTLERCLSPTILLDAKCQIPLYVVTDLLRQIGAKPDAVHTWITPDGRWQNGPMCGTSSKPAAEYIGRAAQEKSLQRRLAELDRAIDDAEMQLESLATSVEELNQRAEAIHREADTAPVDDAVRAAYIQAVAVAREVEGLQTRLVEAEQHAEMKQSLLDETRENRDR